MSNDELSIPPTEIEIAECLRFTDKVEHSVIIRRLAFERDNLKRRLAQTQAELDQLKRQAPLCDEHNQPGGDRSGCLICCLISQGRALSRISYLIDPHPNKMMTSIYDIDCDEHGVVKRAEVVQMAIKSRNLKRQLKKLASYVATCLTENTEQWMIGLVNLLNGACKELEDDTRFEFSTNPMGYGEIRKVEE